MIFNLGSSIGPRRQELFIQIVEAWLSTSADDREVIHGRAGNDRLMLMHPGFIGQDVSAKLDDLQALEKQSLIVGEMTSSMDCVVEPHPKVIETIRLQMRPGEAPRDVMQRVYFPGSHA